MTSMKLINYRGGIARFHVPSSWVEEYDEKEGGTFFEDKPDSGTLRINVIGTKKPSGEDKIQTAYDLIKEMTEANSVRHLPNGTALGHSVRSGKEDGEDLLLYTWYVGIRITSIHFRIIIFTYTILAAQESDPSIQQEIAMLNRSISEGEYPAVRGISGNYVPNS